MRWSGNLVFHNAVACLLFKGVNYPPVAAEESVYASYAHTKCALMIYKQCFNAL